MGQSIGHRFKENWIILSGGLIVLAAGIMLEARMDPRDVVLALIVVVGILTLGRGLLGILLPKQTKTSPTIVASNNEKKLGTSDLLSYWRTVRETIQGFDNILTRNSSQGMTILIAALSIGSGLFQQGFGIIANFVIAGVLIGVIPLMTQTWLYFRLLEKATETAGALENEFLSAYPEEVKLTRHLRRIPGKRSFPVLLSAYVAVLVVATILLVSINFVSLKKIFGI